MADSNPIPLQFSAALIFLVVAAGFVAFNLALGALLRPRRPEVAKSKIYECGEPAIGSAWVRYNTRFYMVALVFLVFDVEVAFLFPVAAVLKWFTEQGLGLFALLEILVFVAILLVGFVYAWRYGHLDWITASDREGLSDAAAMLTAEDREEIAREAVRREGIRARNRAATATVSEA